MTQKIIVNEDIKNQSSIKYARELEKGNILFFPKIPFPFPQDEKDFLLQQRQSGSKARKNIAYKPQIDQITNHESANPEEAARMHLSLRNYSMRASEFLKTLLPSYAGHWKLDYAS